MKTLAIISQKGGAGKTTLAIHIAVAAHRAGYSTAILDMDPQGTAEAWAQWRSDEEPAVVSAKASTLARTLEKAQAAGADIVVIDTPPLAEAEAREAARAADLVLIPCRPRAFDLHAIRTTADLARFAGKPAFAVFNAAPPRAPTLYAEAKAVVEQIGLHVAPVILADRAAFHHSTGGGKAAQEIEPDSKAAEEVSKLWEWLCEQVNLSSRNRVNTLTRARA
jgi:chromosome partitioning protein